MIDDDELRAIYANAPLPKTAFVVISFEASWFDQTFYLQNVSTDDIDVVLESGETITAQYAPMTYTEAGNNDDMSYSRSVLVQQCNDLIAAQMDNRDRDDDNYVTVKFRTYVMYRDGTIGDIKLPVVSTQVISMSRNYQGAKIDTSTKPITKTSTGEKQTTTRIPMLKGNQ